jgi:hypothetical protein
VVCASMLISCIHARTCWGNHWWTVRRCWLQPLWDANCLPQMGHTSFWPVCVNWWSLSATVDGNPLQQALQLYLYIPRCWPICASRPRLVFTVRSHIVHLYCFVVPLSPCCTCTQPCLDAKE